MSKPFGSMPEDTELAARGTGVGGWLLGAALPNLVAASVGARVTRSASQPNWWWFDVPMTVYLLWMALSMAVEARTWRSWSLRAAVLAFAGWGVLRLGAILRGHSIGPVVFAVLQGTAGAGLLYSAWPYAGRASRILTVVLFMVSLAIALQLRTHWR